MAQEKTIASLTEDERLALVALAERILLASRAADDDEAEVEALDELVGQVGEEAYAALVARSDAELASDDDLKAFLLTVTDPEARELILGTVVELALVEGVHPGEAEWVGWASSAWDVPISVEADELGE